MSRTAGRCRQGRQRVRPQGLTPNEYSVESSLPLIFPGLVHSLVENSQKPCASIGNPRKKGNTIFLLARVQLWKSGENPHSLLQSLFSNGAFQKRHREKLLITIYVRSIWEENPNSFLSLLKGHCAGVPGHNHSMQRNTVHSYPESNSNQKQMAGEEYRNGIIICDISPKLFMHPASSFGIS